MEAAFSSRTEINLAKALGDDIIEDLASGRADEIMLNPDGRLYTVYKNGTVRCDENFDEIKAQIAVRQVASMNYRRIDEDSPIVEGDIACLNARFSAVLPPLSRKVCFCIRSLNALDLPYEELLSQGFLSRAQSECIDMLLMEQRNLLICGQTGCGKTTFINSLLGRVAKIDEDCRMLIIEDTPELKPKSLNQVSLVTSEHTSMGDLVRASLRLSPDRIIVGEVRSSEALDMVDALATGHSGAMASIHAGSYEQCLERLKLLISKNPLAPRSGIESLIALAIDAVIVLKKKPSRHVAGIAMLKGFEDGKFIFEPLGE